ncbi:MAG: transposase [Lachnospiraceae bacterium]
MILSRSNARKKRLHPEWEPCTAIYAKQSPLTLSRTDAQNITCGCSVVCFQIAQRKGGYENIITNLPPDEFFLEQVKYIYHFRWGKETSFRDLKHTIGTANFHSKSPKYIEFEIFCRMTLYNFCTIIILDVPIKKEQSKWAYQVNLSMAIKICFAFLFDHIGLKI